MNKDVSVAQNNKQVEELCEDMIVVGPGQMLCEARKKLSLSEEDIAEKLNFKASLVCNIEQDNFDSKLPATFNRGYLRSYAKLVNVNIDEVLSAYDMLDVAEVQRSEMQSFSNLTEKQAEHSRLMWLSYLIVAILFGLMVLWWLQAPEALFPEQKKSIVEQNKESKENTESIAPVSSEASLLDKNSQGSQQINANEQPIEKVQQQAPVTALVEEIEPETEKAIESSVSEGVTSVEAQKDDIVQPAAINNVEAVVKVSTAIFTFSGDCWVNIYDATGERVAWGVKKSGYVMTVSGTPPLEVTLGKPELAAIVYNDETVDMSSFNAGNIAKFTLPLTP